MEKLSGKTALVTGAAGGLGSAIAAELAQRGVKVLLTDLQEERLEKVASTIDGARFVQHDVTNEVSWQHAIEAAMQNFGGLDIVVNNAGVAVFSLLENLSLEKFQFMQRVCLDGAFLGTKWGIQTMRPGGLAGKGGCIINISSLAGIVGSVGLGGYSAAKGGVRLLTKAAAIECAHFRHGIRVNSIHPAVVKGGFGDTVFSDMVKAGLVPDEATAEAALNRFHPMGLGEPGDVADGVCYVASAKWMNGAELVLDGGASAQ
jgi:NAD(P)-dependent dehydrogenase (short-subunit alcohol dehydrogenase family)